VRCASHRIPRRAASSNVARDAGRDARTFDIVVAVRKRVDR
jgi:hypothetical protein